MNDRPHHHGNLREALIDAGLELLAEGGLDGLTLRKAAARAGVSHAAPAHHFPGKHGLVAAIVAKGFSTFTEMMEAERYRDGDAPEAQLAGICRGYLAFARDCPALFQLIFTTDLTGEDDAEAAAAGLAAYTVLAEVAALFEPLSEQPGATELAIWSLVHGYASLNGLHRARDPESGAAIDFDILLKGLALRPRT